jgi:phosphatidylglycerol:prolipoprotein diacylglycerol transferase
MAIACLVFARRHRVPFWSVADTVTLAAPPGLFFGRIGNFINGELYGRATNVRWAMIFPADPLQIPRHPSQLYEALGEGAILFFLLLALERRAVRGGWYRQGLIAGGFLVGYGFIRYLIEFTRQPDPQLGFVAGPFSMGQVLSTLMILIGIVVIAIAYRRPSPNVAPSD